MTIEFDTAKSAKNRAKHGFDLSEFEAMADAMVYPATTVSGEVRHKVIGRIGIDIVTAIVTPRGDRLRVISLRLASRKERKDYEGT